MDKVLTGKKLQAKVAQMKGANKKEIAKECGYVTYTKDGQERIGLMAFYNALLEAEGMTFEAKHEKGKRGREKRISANEPICMQNVT